MAGGNMSNSSGMEEDQCSIFSTVSKLKAWEKFANFIRVVYGFQCPISTQTQSDCHFANVAQHPSHKTAEYLRHPHQTQEQAHSRNSSGSSQSTKSSQSIPTSRYSTNTTKSVESNTTAGSKHSTKRSLRVLPPLPLPLPRNFKTVLARNFDGQRLIQTNQILWVEAPWQLAIFLELLPKLNENLAQLFIDQAGDKQSRSGTISYLQITFAHLETTFILDCHLGPNLFDTPGSTGLSLRHVLESPSIMKGYFDVRNDNEAFYSQFGISLRGVVDIQLMELACRGPMQQCELVESLAQCVQAHLHMENKERLEWITTKIAAKAFCEKYGWSSVNARPLPAALAHCAAQDSESLPHLYAAYLDKLHDCLELWSIIKHETQKRADDCKHPYHNPQPEGVDLNDSRFGPDAFFVPYETIEVYPEFVRAKLTKEDLGTDTYTWWLDLDSAEESSEEDTVRDAIEDAEQDWEEEWEEDAEHASENDSEQDWEEDWEQHSFGDEDDDSFVDYPIIEPAEPNVMPEDRVKSDHIVNEWEGPAFKAKKGENFTFSTIFSSVKQVKHDFDVRITTWKADRAERKRNEMTEREGKKARSKPSKKLRKVRAS